MTKESIIKDLVEKVVNKETHAAAKLISILENDLSSTQNIYSALLPHLNKIVPVIGFTGPPGAGKSTIIDKLIFELSKKNEQIGVLLIDPSSPVSGGAILGDRIRMTKHSLNKNVFIRSMGNRGHSGGLSLATNNAIRILKVLGCKYIFIETVGVGQSDIDIVNIADVAVLVLLPDAGGNIQALKAGILEVADIYVMNKADKEGFDLDYIDVMQMLSMEQKNEKSELTKTLFKTIAIKNEGIKELLDQIFITYNELEQTGKLAEKKNTKIQKELTDILFNDYKNKIAEYFNTNKQLTENKKNNIYELAKQISGNIDK